MLNIVTTPIQKTSAVTSTTDFVKLATEAASEVPLGDDEEDVDGAPPDASDGAPAVELEKSIGDGVVESVAKIVSTTTSPSLAVEVTTTSLSDFVSDASAEAVSAMVIVSTTTPPSLAVEVMMTSLPDFVSDASGEVVELALAAASTSAIPAHT
jgi:hypothetical protein